MGRTRDNRLPDYERKNTVTVRMDPHLLAHFNKKAENAPGSRTRLMENAMRRGEFYDKITQAVATAFVNTPELYEKYAPAEDRAEYWPSDGSRMNPMDAAIANLVSEVVAKQCEDTSSLLTD